MNDGATPLFMASQQGYHDIVKLLLINRASVDITRKDGWTALHLACCKNHEANIKELLEYNANPIAVCFKGETPMSMMLENGHQNTSKSLMQRVHEVYFRKLDEFINGEECPICLGDITSPTDKDATSKSNTKRLEQAHDSIENGLQNYVTQNSLSILPCGHIVHTTCIDSWCTNKHAICPLCDCPVTIGNNDHFPPDPLHSNQ